MAIIDELRGYKQRTSTLSRDSFLGTIVTFGVKDCDVKHSDVVALLKQADIGHMAPKPPADSDKFRTAAENGQRRKFAADSNGVVQRLLVRAIDERSPSKDEPGYIVRKVVSEFVNPKARSLQYPEMGGGELVFLYSGGLVEVEVYDRATPEAATLIQDIVESYEDTRGTLDGNALRGIITTTLKRCQAVPWADALAFAPIAYEDVIGALESWALLMRDELKVKVDVDSFPLLDDTKQRGKVLDKAKDGIKAEVDDLRKKVEAAGVAPSLRLVTSINSSLQILLGKAKDYEALLAHEELVTATNLDVLELQVQQLYRRAS